MRVRVKRTVKHLKRIFSFHNTLEFYLYVTYLSTIRQRVKSARLAPHHDIHQIITAVRHGEATTNVLPQYQTPDDPLTLKGREQAKLVAKRIAQQNTYDIIVASPFKRALQTAFIISRETRLPVVRTTMLTEKNCATDYEGLPHNHPVAQAIHDVIAKHRDIPNWHYSDEENDWDVLRRAVDTAQFIKKMKHINILIVSHNYFIKALMGVLTYGDSFSVYDLRKLDEGPLIHNTGIVQFTRSGKNYKLAAYDDYAHLQQNDNQTAPTAQFALA